VRDNLRAARRLIDEPCGLLDEMSQRYGSTFALTLGPKQIVVLGDALIVNEVLALPSSSFRWGRMTKSLEIVIGPTSMIVSDGADHARRRGLTQPGFAKRRLDGWMPVIVAETDRLIEELIDGRRGPVDLHVASRRLIRRLVIRVLFGEELAARSDEIGDVIEPAMAYAGGPVMSQFPHPFPVGQRAAAKRARRALDQILDQEIARRRGVIVGRSDDRGEAARSDGSTRVDGGLLDALISAEDGGDPLSDAEIRDQIVTLIGAGFDTTSASLSWTLAEIAGQPDIWQRLRIEADRHLDRAVSSASLQELPWSQATIRESLRLHPAGPISPRETLTAITAGPYDLAAGTVIAWSPYLMGRDPAAWSEPLRFRPERFMPIPIGSDEVLTPDPMAALAWLPFGRGPRRCIGFALAQMELVLIVSRLAQQLDIELVSPSLPRPCGMIVTRPEGGLPARVTARAPAAGGRSGPGHTGSSVPSGSVDSGSGTTNVSSPSNGPGGDF